MVAFRPALPAAPLPDTPDCSVAPLLELPVPADAAALPADAVPLAVLAPAIPVVVTAFTGAGGADCIAPEAAPWALAAAVPVVSAARCLVDWAALLELSRT